MPKTGTGGPCGASWPATSQPACTKPQICRPTSHVSEARHGAKHMHPGVALLPVYRGCHHGLVGLVRCRAGVPAGLTQGKRNAKRGRGWRFLLPSAACQAACFLPPPFRTDPNFHHRRHLLLPPPRNHLLLGGPRLPCLPLGRQGSKGAQLECSAGLHVVLQCCSPPSRP